ncbi:hypothetical protein AAG570_011325 [Ranatra chinensis]|uniref:Putative alpha-L-fucosidase n=1 Tax=Ranatra chinensis TaxID=642074 RepID=A0ABD0YWJ1_9HEMI
MEVSWALIIALPIVLAAGLKQEPYKPDWASLDSRPNPDWYDKAKIGIFIHWGVYSVPSFTSEWFWINWKGNPTPSKGQQKKINDFMKSNYKPGFSYQDFAQDFTAEFFNVTKWVEIVQKSGAKYVVLTSKHHDGFALWPSKYSFSWNSMDVGPHRDIVGELADAVKKSNGLHFGLYHSLFEWFHPMYLSDKANNYTTNSFVKNKILPELMELVQKYKPEILWSDGEWEAESSYWQAEQFLAWLYNSSPVAKSVLVNDRWGRGTLCKHGGYYTCSDRFNPGVLQTHKWENAMTIDKHSWGYNRYSDLEDYITPQELIDTMAETIACGGNILINVGPSKDGKIPPIFQDRLYEVGNWLSVNGEAIYGSRPWDVCQNDTTTPKIWYTTDSTGETLHVIMLRWPASNVLYLACPQTSKKSVITMIGTKGRLEVTDKHILKISLPDKAVVKTNYAWVLKITNISSP